MSTKLYTTLSQISSKFCSIIHFNHSSNRLLKVLYKTKTLYNSCSAATSFSCDAA